jgi:hypothetical protein
MACGDIPRDLSLWIKKVLVGIQIVLAYSRSAVLSSSFTGITRPDRPLLAVSSKWMASPIWPRGVGDQTSAGGFSLFHLWPTSQTRCWLLNYLAFKEEFRGGNCACLDRTACSEINVDECQLIRRAYALESITR